MEVYVLLGHIDYEGDDVLGVYSSEELAEAAWTDFCDRKKTNYYNRHSVKAVFVDDFAKGFDDD